MSYFQNIVVVVCGGRDFNDKNVVYGILNNIHKKYIIELLGSGGASGADTLAENWARNKHVSRTILEANWDRYGNMAGPIRNQKLLDIVKPDLVVAFPGNTGTQDMINKVKRYETSLMKVEEDGTFEITH